MSVYIEMSSAAIPTECIIVWKFDKEESEKATHLVEIPDTICGYIYSHKLEIDRYLAAQMVIIGADKDWIPWNIALISSG